MRCDCQSKKADTPPPNTIGWLQLLNRSRFPRFGAEYNNMVSRHCYLHADDLQCYISSPISNITKAIETLNLDLQNICNWAQVNGLRVNPSKSKFIAIASRQLMSSININALPEVVFNNTSIPLSTSVKNLGIILNQNLTWEEHVNIICRRAYAALHSLYRLKNFLPQTIKKTLVQSLVLTHLDYCDIALIDIPDELSRRLQRVQNACIRYIFNVKRYDHISPYRRELGWMDVNARRSFRSLCALYKMLKFNQPVYLASRFQFLSDRHSLNTRSRDTKTLSFPSHKSSFYSKSFTVQTTRAWNEIPCNIRSSNSLEIFRSKLLAHFKEIYLSH